MEVIEATFEDGVLRPSRRLALRPVEHVGIVVVRRPDPARWNLERLARTDDRYRELAEEGLDAWQSDLEREDRG